MRVFVCSEIRIGYKFLPAKIFDSNRKDMTKLSYKDKLGFILD